MEAVALFSPVTITHSWLIRGREWAGVGVNLASLQHVMY